MKNADSKLRQKRIILNDQSLLVYENDTTSHLVKNNTNYIFFDAGTMAIGRIASLIANVLNNKYDTDYSPHVKHQYHIVLYNYKNFILTGDKMKDRKYLKYTGYPGGQREINPHDLYLKNPRTLFQDYIIQRMLNKNRSRQSTLNNILYFEEMPDTNIMKMKDDSNPIQKTVDSIINTYLNKRKGGL